MNLHPELGIGGAAADDHLAGCETAGTEILENEFGTIADAFHQRAEDVAACMAERQAVEAAARRGIGKGCAIALEMIKYDKTVRARRYGRGLFIEACHIGLSDHPVEPGDD